MCPYRGVDPLCLLYPTAWDFVKRKGVRSIHAYYENIVAQIKERVDLQDAIERYTGEPIKHGKMRCPFHGEQDASFTIYPHNNTFYCFGCGAGGDLIDFVRRFFNLDFRDALQRIDTDFGLCLLQRPTLTAYRKAQAEAQHRRQEREQRQKAAAELDARYWAAYDRWLRYDRIICEQRPASADHPPSAAFMEAISNIENAKYQLDALEQERRKQTSGKPNTTNDSGTAAKPGNL